MNTDPKHLGLAHQEQENLHQELHSSTQEPGRDAANGDEGDINVQRLDDKFQTEHKVEANETSRATQEELRQKLLLEQAKEEELRAKAQKKAAKRRAKQIRREEYAKARRMSAPYRGHRVAAGFGLALAVLLSGVVGGGIVYQLRQADYQALQAQIEALKGNKDLKLQSPKPQDEKKTVKENANKDQQDSTHEKSQSDQKPVTRGENLGAQTSASQELSTPEIAQKAVPAVVAILTQSTVRTPFGDSLIQGAGSGVIIDAKGYVVTNHHVIEGANQITVKLASGDDVVGDVVQTDPDNDIAVVKLESGREYPAIEMADSDLVVVGEKAVAIGNPLGNLEGTVTEGIVSATGRTISSVSELTGRQVTIENALQTDASINSGNSGGALLNAEGKLIGINVMKAGSPNMQVAVDGIGFAIPSNHVKEIASQFIDYDEHGKPSFGIVGIALSQEQQRSFDLPQGVYVRAIVPNSGAAESDLNRGDIITQIDGQAVTSLQDINALKAKKSIGDKVKITYFRAGSYAETEVQLKSSKEIEQTTGQSFNSDPSGRNPSESLEPSSRSSENAEN